MLVLNYQYNNYDEILVTQANGGAARVSTNIGAIVGAIMGFIFVVIIIIIIVRCCKGGIVEEEGEIVEIHQEIVYDNSQGMAYPNGIDPCAAPPMYPPGMDPNYPPQYPPGQLG